MDGFTEVFGDLREGDMLALRCTDALKPGTKVKTVFQKPDPASISQDVRPAYNDHGCIYSIPEAERKDLALPGNRNKPKAY